MYDQMISDNVFIHMNEGRFGCFELLVFELFVVLLKRVKLTERKCKYRHDHHKNRAEVVGGRHGDVWSLRILIFDQGWSLLEFKFRSLD